MRALWALIVIVAPVLGGCAAIRLMTRGDVDPCTTAAACAQRLEDEAAMGDCRGFKWGPRCDPLLTRMVAFGPEAEPHAARMLGSWDSDVVAIGVWIFARLEQPSPRYLEAMTAVVRGRTNAPVSEAIDKMRAGLPIGVLREQLAAGQCDVLPALTLLGPAGATVTAEAEGRCCKLAGRELAGNVSPEVIESLRSRLLAAQRRGGDPSCAFDLVSPLGPKAASLEPELRQLASRDPARAYQTLRAVGVRKDLTSLASAYLERHGRAAYAIREIAELHAEGRPLTPTLVALLRSGRLDQRAAAAFTLGYVGGEEVVPELIAAARDPRAWSVAAAAVVSLSRFASEDARAVVREVEREYWFSFVREQAARAASTGGRELLDRAPSSCRYGADRPRGVPAPREPMALNPGTKDRVDLSSPGSDSVRVEDGRLIVTQSDGGGVQFVDRSGAARWVHRGDVRTLVSTPSAVFALRGRYWTSPGASDELLRLQKGTHGEWIATLALELPGHALAWGINRRGALIVAAEQGAVVVLEGGSVEEIPCPRSDTDC